ncbi:MAG TPA: hypothetical protein PLF78_00520 [Caulobacter sp.]|nr:hypothetical protein [Caulobacter sp.]
MVILATAAWFGRRILLIVATVLAFHPIPIPPLLQPRPESALEARMQDLRHFEHVPRNERSMTPEMRARFDRRIADIRSRAATMTDAEFMLGLARAQAEIDNAHSNGNVASMVERFPHLPVRAAFLGDDLRILRAARGYEDLLGSRITHIGGQPVGEVTRRFRDAFGGNDASFRVVAPLLLETPAYLNAVGIPGDPIEVQLERIGEAPKVRLLEAFTPSADARWVTPGALPLHWRRDTATVWTSLRPSGDPLYLQLPDRGYWRRPLPDQNAVYINLRTNIDDDTGVSLKAFVAETVADLRRHRPAAVIVDLRFNPGGDYSLTHPLMSALGDIVGPNGRIYLLSSNNTFSAAIVSMAFAKQGAPDRTVIVGEEIGDRTAFWAEGWRYKLPNSGFGARYSTAFYDLTNGCTGLFRCYWGAFFLMPVIVDDLDVDIPAPLTFADYVAGRDPALEAIEQAEAVRRGRIP